MQKDKVVHLTSVHSRFDTRIFLKECRSLVAAGYQVSLIVADGNDDEVRDGVEIFDVGSPTGRIQRIAIVSRRIVAHALALNASTYHLHDPELLLIAGRLMRAGKTVIFDAHEDVPVQILSKHYIHPWIRQWLSRSYSRFEFFVCNKLSAVVAATPFIANRFLSINPTTVNINNYAIPDELGNQEPDPPTRKNQVSYVGGISKSRGIGEVINAMSLMRHDAQLALCGRFEDLGYRAEVTASAGWTKVRDMGWLSRERVRQVLLESMAGVVTLHPQQNFLDSHPIKMFEYMSAAVPVIASDFPLWRKIIEGNDCGICVDPQDPKAIAMAIDYLLEHPAEAREMGENGRQAVNKHYNWRNEERKLLALYEQLGNEANS